MPTETTCRSCGEKLRGRSDKKFCNDFCRNQYNNQLKADSHQFTRKINNVLCKNRRILEHIMICAKQPGGTIKTTLNELDLMGFNFNYITHYETNETGKTYYYCYEYAYLPLGNQQFQVVRKRIS